MYVDDPTLTTAERRLLEALADPKWDYRTIEGLAKQTGLSAREIADILRKFRSHLVHQAPFTDKFGRELYTLMKGRAEFRDLLAQLRIIAGKSFQ